MSQAQTAAHSHDGDHSPEEVKQHIRRYLYVFYVLLFGTIITVLASYIHFKHPALAIGVALFIASVKGFLVAGYFMHLMSERKMIYSILAFTVFFFIGLMALTLFSYADFPPFATH